MKVTDNNGAVGRDTVKVTVSAAANISPKANAGADKEIILPVNKISLAGSGSDVDGTITNYLWSKISGPSSYNIVNQTSAVTDVTGLIQGVYQFELKVTDNLSAIGTSTVMIIVKAAVSVNIPPVANAGPDITIVLPYESVSLKGEGSDKDGSVVGYCWKLLSVPSESIITYPLSANAFITNLQEGTYTIELKVTDNLGATGKDTMILTAALGRLSSQQNSVNLFPNPVINSATLEITTSNPDCSVSIVITDSKGKIISLKSRKAEENKLVKKVDLSNFTKGIYMITVYFDQKEKKSMVAVKL